MVSIRNSLWVLVLLGTAVAVCRGEERVYSQGKLYSPYNLTTHYYDQKVDHFSYGVQNRTFSQKYLVNDASWNVSGGPILFYAGNEGAIELFAQNTGFMFELAPQLQAMVVFAEHRYYGSSLPFGNRSYTHKQYYQYQSSMQALEDYVELVQFLRHNITGAANSPVIVFGGSYGGMLAAWMRAKYPHIVQGAIAASAPVAQFTGLTPCSAFGRLTTQVYHNASASCDALIRRSWAAIDTLTSTPNGKAWLAAEWKLCEPIKTEEDVVELKNYLLNVWTDLAMANYPYPANFLAPLPAYPVKQVCIAMKDSDGTPKGILSEIYKGLNIYYNYTTKAKCQPFTNDGMPATLDGNGWDLQSCTEMVMPMCTDGVHDMFEQQKWDLGSYSAGCRQRWATEPEPYKMQHIYGGRDLVAASNIVLSNGDLDPWSTGGILETISPSVIAYRIAGGAHHIDLRAAEHADPKDVTFCRNLELINIKRWIEEHKKALLV